MSDTSDPNDRAGWEYIWRSGKIPPRYESSAPPNTTVVEWADQLTPGGFILDVGCGIGRHLLYLGARGFRVAGVDVSPSSIDISRQVCTEHGIPFEGQVADMTALPWADHTFDAALSTSTVHHHLRGDILKTLDEIRRVLKPGGWLLVDFPCKDSAEYQRLLNQVQAGELSEVEPDTFVNQRPDIEEHDDSFLPHHYSDEADARDLLRGFDIIRLWADLREMTREGQTGMMGKLVAWARKPLPDG